MTVRLHSAAVLALLCSLLVAGCTDRERMPMAAETEDPFFVQGRQLQKQGRNPEALTAFLKVIEKRGERASAESHFEVGQIYLNHTKEPVEAYHHFRKYLELQPNSRQAELVRGMAKVALREFARTLPGRPMDDQSVRLQADDEILKLRRENDELRAELAVLRGGGAMPVNRSARLITLPTESRTVPIPVPTATVVDPSVIRAPAQASMLARPPSQPPPPKPLSPSASLAAGSAPRPAPPAGRTHTVAAKDTLFSVAKRSGVKLEEVFAANRDVMRTLTDLRPGMTLKIPAPAAAPAARR